MAKGPEITDEVRMLAARLHTDHPKWTNSMIRNEILASVHKNDKSLPKDKHLPKDWPSKYSIDRIMPGIRERVRLSELNPDPRDNPWTIHSLVKYPIPAEALPSVLRVWFYTMNNKVLTIEDPDGGPAVEMENPPLTIREAQWIGRIYTIIKDTHFLWFWAISLSTFDEVAEDAGIEYLGSQFETIQAVGELEGVEFTDEEIEGVTGIPRERWGLMLTPDERAYYSDGKLWNLKERKANKQKEAKNERKHKAKRQT